MNTSKDPLVFIGHILGSIHKIESYVAGISKKEFLKSSKTQDAVIRNLEIIGEAAKNIPEFFRNRYSAVPWRKISGFRHLDSYVFWS